MFTVFDSDNKEEKQDIKLEDRWVSHSLKDESKLGNIIQRRRPWQSVWNILMGIQIPIRQINEDQNYSDSPWITYGLQNACRKKHTLHREFIKHRTKEAENKYK